MATRFYGWGDEKIVFSARDRPQFVAYLKNHGLLNEVLAEPTFDITQVKAPASRMPAELVAELGRILGVEAVSTTHADRVRHATGKSYCDLMRLRSGVLDKAPDVVLFLQQSGALPALFKWCAERGVALVPFGGGTSVVSGVEAEQGGHFYVAALNLTRLNKVLHIDEKSLIATVEAGILGPALEQELRARGLMLGHYPQSFEFSTLGGWIAARSSGQNSMGYGGIEKIVQSVRMQSPFGALQTPPVPRQSTGPEIKDLILGSEGIFGVITDATVRVQKAPAQQCYFMYAFPNFSTASEAARLLTQARLPLCMVRVSDEEETAATFSLGTHNKGLGGFVVTHVLPLLMRTQGIGRSYSTMIVGLEGEIENNLFARQKVAEIVSDFPNFYLGQKPGAAWLKNRFRLPYLRDVLLSQGILIDTLETATTWDNLFLLYEAVRTAMRAIATRRNEKIIVYTHISHVYGDGASLYFTFLAAPMVKEAFREQWLDYKKAASAAIVGNGGVISHHHGMGMDHRAYSPNSVAETELLRGIKNDLDPANIMNPGKVL